MAGMDLRPDDSYTGGKCLGHGQRQQNQNKWQKKGRQEYRQKNRRGQNTPADKELKVSPFDG